MLRIDLEAVEARHTEWREPPRNPADPAEKPVRPECNYCEPRWPCDASLLVARVRELEAALVAITVAAQEAILLGPSSALPAAIERAQAALDG